MHKVCIHGRRPSRKSQKKTYDSFNANTNELESLPGTPKREGAEEANALLAFSLGEQRGAKVPDQQLIMCG